MGIVFAIIFCVCVPIILYSILTDGWNPEKLAKLKREREKTFREKGLFQPGPPPTEQEVNASERAVFLAPLAVIAIMGFFWLAISNGWLKWLERLI